MPCGRKGSGPRQWQKSAVFDCTVSQGDRRGRQARWIRGRPLAQEVATGSRTQCCWDRRANASAGDGRNGRAIGLPSVARMNAIALSDPVKLDDYPFEPVPGWSGTVSYTLTPQV